MCEFCNAGFDTQDGLNTHQGQHCGEAKKLLYESPFVVEKILDVRGPPERRFYKVKWKNYELNTVKEKLNWEFSRNVEKASKLVKNSGQRTHI